MLLPAYYLSFLSLSLTRSPSQMSIFLENGLICCDASFPHYALTPKNPVNYAITPKIRLDYALRHYALHFPHYAITQKNWANYALRNQKKGLLRHYANLYPPPCSCTIIFIENESRKTLRISNIKCVLMYCNCFSVWPSNNGVGGSLFLSPFIFGNNTTHNRLSRSL